MTEALLKGITIGLLLSIAVGPVLFAVIKHSVNNGYRGGFAFAIGVSLSDISLVLLANLFTELFLALRVYEKAIGIGGSILLICIGLYFLLFKKIHADDAGKLILKQRGKDLLAISLSGFFMNIMNPGVILFWLTIGTSLITYSAPQRLLIYGVALGTVLTADFLKVLLAGRIREKLNLRTVQLLNRISGIIYIVFGVVLMVGLFYYVGKQ
ncbi:MAG: LysE family translocator [Chitinophagaceae bacterium]|jgi:threonine/homoserine/homoserine lactone efflux protein